MIRLSDYRTETAFPAEMKTAERMALAYAYDRQKKLFLERLRRVYIWADLDNVDENKLDFLAVECRVLFYNSSLSPDVKRKLIQNSIYWYMKFVIHIRLGNFQPFHRCSYGKIQAFL